MINSGDSQQLDKQCLIISMINGLRMLGLEFIEKTKSRKFRNVERINHPKHCHITELFGAMRVFEEWKAECGWLNKKFITRETYEDLKWLIFAVARQLCI